jgi:hypothetical protein
MITIGKAWELNEEPSVQEKEMLLVYVRALGMKVGISCEMTFEEFRKFRGSTSCPHLRLYTLYHANRTYERCYK